MMHLFIILRGAVHILFKTGIDKIHCNFKLLGNCHKFVKTVIEVLTVVIIFNKMFVFTDRESLPKAGANFPKQKACPGTDRQEEGTAICAQCWSRI